MDEDEDDEPMITRLKRIALGEEAKPSADSIEYSRFGLYLMWARLVHPQDHEAKEQAWAAIKESFGDQKEIINYMNKKLLPWIEQWCAAFTNYNLNFGGRTTSPVEIVNRWFKTFVVTGRSTIFATVFASFRMVLDMKSLYEQRVGNQKRRIKKDMAKMAWLGTVTNEISYKGQEEIVQQYRIMLKYLKAKPGEEPPDCPENDQITLQKGIISAYEMLQRVKDCEHKNTAFHVTKLDFHPF